MGQSFLYVGVWAGGDVDRADGACDRAFAAKV